ncbi:hypothetical protein SeMB42_g06884 [Synchytrium endobioticum]|uniref:UspA domain-containing protein n=1 Tax=Synchytrium endobioticum TaxID=286115 RepID=A0A507CEK3_9FUNG|nr:hypothetical protein SeMB42_g06884 [Synchytrium endobioticum]TPX37911.1 hypothetical protein SeLEV6574_g07826 [Synchytrium endobioticum]
MTADTADSTQNVVKIGIAYNNTPGSLKALQTAVDLCMGMNVHSYILYIVYVVALNPPAILPGMDGIEQGFNAQIHKDAKKELQECKAHLDMNYAGRVNYEFIQVEGEGEIGPLIKEQRLGLSGFKYDHTGAGGKKQCGFYQIFLVSSCICTQYLPPWKLS